MGRMRYWNGYRWTEYSGAPLTGPVVTGAVAIDTLDPAVQVVTDEANVKDIEAAHERFRTEHAETGPLERVDPLEQPELEFKPPPKRAGALPLRSATFTFDTSEED